MRAHLLASVLLTACSPFSGGEHFNCTASADCTATAGGMCEPGTDLCAYPASICPDPGYAYGDSSGALSGMCVPPIQLPSDGGTGSGSDPSVDAFVVPPDAPPTSECEGNPNVMSICIGIPQSDRDFSNKLLLSKGAFGVDSDCDFTVTPPTTPDKCAGSACTQSGPQLCVIQGHNIHLNNTELRDPSGSRPLVFVATGDITVDGLLDVRTQRGDAFGLVAPGAATGSCNSASGQNGGGGGGGSYGTPAGNGGNGDGNHGTPQQVPADFTIVRSGCHAGAGGSSNQSQGGDGGYSGGVVYLIAKGTITINGTIDVSGMGGGYGGTSAGGGGGGPGGMVGLDGHTINIAGKIIANAGAGGGGGGAQTGGQGGQAPAPNNNGQSGQNGGMARAMGGAGGGTGANAGGAGGAGTDMGNGAGSDGKDQVGDHAGAGGGGGGQGIVWVVASPGTTTMGTQNIIGVRVDKQ